MFRSSQVLNSLHHHHGCRLASGFASLVGVCSMNAVKISWQGTNMYTLYQSYNVDISTLFVTGRGTFQAGIPASKRHHFHLELLELCFYFFRLYLLCHFRHHRGNATWAKCLKAEIFQGVSPPLEPRYVDKWGRKLGCIVYLIIEVQSRRLFKRVFFYLLGIMIHPGGVVICL